MSDPKPTQEQIEAAKKWCEEWSGEPGDYMALAARDAEKDRALASSRQRAERLSSELLGFVEYFGAIGRGEVGGSRPTLRTFERILLDKARAALAALRPARQDTKP